MFLVAARFNTLSFSIPSFYCVYIYSKMIHHETLARLEYFLQLLLQFGDAFGCLVPLHDWTINALIGWRSIWTCLCVTFDSFRIQTITILDSFERTWSMINLRLNLIRSKNCSIHLVHIILRSFHLINIQFIDCIYLYK